MNDQQFGFRRYRNTNDAVIQLTSDKYDGLEKPKLVYGIFFDFSKAFDSVDHLLLLKKCQEEFNLPTDLLRILCSYLTEWTATIKVNTTLSGPIPLTVGVLQGSIGGPILYLLFINSLIPSITLTSKTYLYADDLACVVSGDNEAELLHNVKAVSAQVND